MKKTSRRGGKRPGAGRKPKWDFWFKFKIGQECEILFRDAEARALQRANDHTFNADSELKHLWRTPARIPIKRRKAYIASDLFKYHQEEIETELKFLAEGIDAEGPAQRVVQIRYRARRGTRKAIIKQIAEKHSLTENQVDNLWQAYRRFEKSI